jgi:hypothetical protein
MAWREHAAPIIAEVLKQTAGKPEDEIKKALKEAYPFGPRKYHPYKIWLDEIKVQRGKRKFNERKLEPVPENQTDLFK